MVHAMSFLLLVPHLFTHVSIDVSVRFPDITQPVYVLTRDIKSTCDGPYGTTAEVVESLPQQITRHRIADFVSLLDRHQVSSMISEELKCVTLFAPNDEAVAQNRELLSELRQRPAVPQPAGEPIYAHMHILSGVIYRCWSAC